MQRAKNKCYSSPVTPNIWYTVGLRDSSLAKIGGGHQNGILNITRAAAAQALPSEPTPPRLPTAGFETKGTAPSRQRAADWVNRFWAACFAHRPWRCLCAPQEVSEVYSALKRGEQNHPENSLEHGPDLTTREIFVGSEKKKRPRLGLRRQSDGSSWAVMASWAVAEMGTGPGGECGWQTAAGLSCSG